MDFRVVDEIQVIESKWAKAVGRQFFLDGNFVFITFLPAVIICLPALCLALTGCVCTFYPGFPFLFTAISAPGLLVLLNHSELLVLCWVALEGLSKEIQDPNVNPCKISLSSPILGTTCVFCFPSVCSWGKKGWEMPRKTVSFSPLKWVLQSLLYRLNLECVLRTGLLKYICPGGRFPIHMAQCSKSCFTLLWWFTVNWEHLPLLGLGRAE